MVQDRIKRIIKYLIIIAVVVFIGWKVATFYINTYEKIHMVEAYAKTLASNEYGSEFSCNFVARYGDIFDIRCENEDSSIIITYGIRVENDNYDVVHSTKISRGQ